MTQTRESSDPFDQPRLHVRFSLQMTWCVWALIFLGTGGARATASAHEPLDWFRSVEERTMFHAFVDQLDVDYNPAERLLRRPFVPPSYRKQTSVTGDLVHPTRDSARYAVALLDTGDPARIEQACDIANSNGVRGSRRSPASR